MEKTGNLVEGKTPCVNCGCACENIEGGDPVCTNCRSNGKQASARGCSGSCKTIDELTDTHKD